MSLRDLRTKYPWPRVKPDAKPDNHGWFHERKRQELKRVVGPQVKLVLEVGSWLGLSTRWFLQECPNAHVLAVDHWKGSEEHQRLAEAKRRLPTLYETFLVNCWSFLERLTPVRESSVVGMLEIASMGLEPDLIYIDAAHDADNVHDDVKTAMHLFPEAVIAGDDWGYEGVKKGVEWALRERLVERPDARLSLKRRSTHGSC